MKNSCIYYKGNPSTWIYFLKKYPEDNLPSTPCIKVCFCTSVLLDADTCEVPQVNQSTPFSDMTEEMNYTVKTI
ncbi:hypothetical protein DFH28DRAFT_892031 [Melampsora americana]|nr:hypothetical protein DFH28DRAFT_892031 [Melampsora americana]